MPETLGAIRIEMLKLYFILTLILFPFFAFCQDTSSSYRNQLKLSGLRAVNILNPGIEISYERLADNNFSTRLLVGIATNIIGKPFKRLRGYSIGLEKKYFFRKCSKSWKYISLALIHSDMKYREETFGNDPITNLIVVDTFTISRKTTSLAFNYGIQFYKKRFVFDLNLGAGLKYRTIEHYDRTFEYKGPREPFDLHRAANVERKGIAFHLPINIQLGYRF